MNNNKKPGMGRGIGIYIILFLIIAGVIYGIQGGAQPSNTQTVKNIEFSEMIDYLEAEKVTEITINEGSRQYKGVLKDGTVFIAYAPTNYDMAVISQNYIVPQAADGLKVYSVKPSSWGAILSWLPTLLLIGFMIFFWTRMMGGGAGGQGGVMSFGKNRARMVNDKRVTFDDVAGLDEEKQELSEIVDFLKAPKKYLKLGARIPKGVLLVGPPGTGKTYISKAVAGEAGVPFFSISGSDFVEMFLGVGASRVRDLFNDAKKNAPCIVFIDEIDAVGRQRGAGLGGGNDEREQTLNQLLVEMDGFSANEGIIVLAATNRPDVLDPAILRPGRFDRQVVIGTPDVKGREAVFKIYAKNKPLDPEVDLKTLARRTPGFTPADIENMMNEAALLTARRNGSTIHMDDLEEAITRVIAGPKKKSRVMSDKEKRLTAFHEAGHAIVMRSIPGSDPVHQVTIMPRGLAGGFTMQLPEQDKYYETKTDMEHDIMHLLGGRIAEALVLGDISTGASNDLERATKIAHEMVTKYGMSDAIGPVNYSSSDQVFLGRDFTSKQNFSEELAARIDAEVRRIIDSAYAQAEEILKTHDAELHRVAEGLLELETLDAEQFEALYTGSKTKEELEQEYKITSEEREKREKAEAEEAARREAAERAAQPHPQVAAEATRGRRLAYRNKNGQIIIRNIEEYIDQPEETEEDEAPKEAAASDAPAADAAEGGADNSAAPAQEETSDVNDTAVDENTYSDAGDTGEEKRTDSNE